MAAEGGLIGLVEEGDSIEIDIPNRSIHLAVEQAVLDQRRNDMDARGKQGWKPNRDRVVSAALKAYGLLATSASKGAVRDLDQLQLGHQPQYPYRAPTIRPQFVGADLHVCPTQPKLDIDGD